MKTVIEVIEELQNGANSYWNASVIRNRCGGEICYHPEMEVFSDRIDGEYWDISGKVEDDGKWVEWWIFELNNPEKAKEICQNLNF